MSDRTYSIIENCPEHGWQCQHAKRLREEGYIAFETALKRVADKLWAEVCA